MLLEKNSGLDDLPVLCKNEKNQNQKKKKKKNLVLKPYRKTTISEYQILRENSTQLGYLKIRNQLCE